MELELFCINHPHKFAKRYCRNCDILICNTCALDYHSDHIESIESLNKKYISDTNDFFNIVNQFLNKSIGYVNTINQIGKCMNVIYHEATLYCKTCMNYICSKCSPYHKKIFHDHDIVNVEDYMKKLKTKSLILYTILEFQSKDYIDKNEEYLKYVKTTNEQNSFFNQFLSRIFNLKYNLQETYRLLRNIYLNLYQKIFEFYRKNQKKLLVDKQKLYQFQRIYEQMENEKEKAKMNQVYISFESLINELIGEEEYIQYIKLISEEEKIKLYIKTVFNNLVQVENDFIKKVSSEVNDINAKIQTQLFEMSKYLKSNFGLSHIEIDDLFKESKRQTNYVNINDINYKNKVLLEEYQKRNETIKDQRFNRLEKEIVFSENMNLSKKTSLKSLPSKPETFFQGSEYFIQLQQFPSKKFTYMKHIEENEEVNLNEYSDEEMCGQTASIDYTNKKIKENESIDMKNSEGLIKIFDLNTVIHNKDDDKKSKECNNECISNVFDMDMNVDSNDYMNLSNDMNNISSIRRMKNGYFNMNKRNDKRLTYANEYMNNINSFSKKVMFEVNSETTDLI